MCRFIHECGVSSVTSASNRSLAKSLGRYCGLAMVLALSSVGAGCLQATVGGQTLPSAYYLNDDVQYFPAGPETRLYNQIQALERYKLEKKNYAGGNARTP